MYHCGAGAAAARQLRRALAMEDHGLKEEHINLVFAKENQGESKSPASQVATADTLAAFKGGSAESTLNDIPEPLQYLSRESLERLNEEDDFPESDKSEEDGDVSSSSSEGSYISSVASDDSDFVANMPAMRNDACRFWFPPPLSFLHPRDYAAIMRTF
eukprot:TRINITY_DN50257_c0_g1_i1.p2 TRINITY_DN50257_c0_g1~~TRINITY_DN50257_c0_g1_i1.p2  ORF type:complete len:159 (+),score=40.27 TRINITY_DN50257_c0_g1_i1:78-554(+)